MLQSRELLVGAGIAIGGALLLYVLAKRGGDIGKAIGAGASDAAAGVVIGVGSTVGLPDTTDAQTVAEGRAALDRGDIFEASQKLPATEFLGGLGSRLGLWVYDVTHPDEAEDLGLAQVGVTVTAKE